MKKYIIIYTIITIAILAGFFILFMSDNTATTQMVDTVEINHIIQQITLNWENIELLEQIAFSYPFFIIDDYGQAVYSSIKDLPTNIHTAIAQGFLPMNIDINGRNMGTVLIETIRPNKGIYVRFYIVIITFALLLLTVAIFLIFIYKSIILPFKRIQHFAHKISIGILDEQLPISKNNPFGLFTQSFDIMRASLLEARQKQIIAERAKKELIASLSHDIKTPITSIKLTIELLQIKNNDPATAEKLKIIETKANQINALMNDILHSTLEELGELQISLSSEDSSILSDLFKNSDHLSKTKLSPIPSCLIEIDKVRMEQVIGNIIANSYKYADTNIDVNFNIQGKGLQIDIIDYGDGIESDEIELVATKFYRGKNAKILQKEGEGLGLYIAKLLIEKMGGALEVLNHNNGFAIRIWINLSF